MKKWLLALLVLVCLIIGAGYWFAAIPDSAEPNGPQSQARYRPGPYQVISERFTLVDDRRPTPGYGDTPDLPQRVLDGEIWRPDGLSQPGPLVLYSHGFLSFRQEGLYLTRFLASHGYTVAAVDFPLTSIYKFENPQMADVANQPGDVSFLLDTLLARNADPEDGLYNTIDPDRIAAAGVSLGGMTSMLVTFHPKFRDPRIDAIVSIAGPTSIFTADFFSTSDVPFLMVYASADAIVPYEKNTRVALENYPDVTLVTLADASHAGFALPAATINRFLDNPDGMACDTMHDKLDLAQLAEQQDEFVAALGGPEEGMDLNGDIDFCTASPIPLSMKAARQQMFTTLATHAFLDSRFAQDPSVRKAAEQYLLHTLAEENRREVSVTR